MSLTGHNVTDMMDILHRLRHILLEPDQVVIRVGMEDYHRLRNDPYVQSSVSSRSDRLPYEAICLLGVTIVPSRSYAPPPIPDNAIFMADMSDESRYVDALRPIPLYSKRFSIGSESEDSEGESL